MQYPENRWEWHNYTAGLVVTIIIMTIIRIILLASYYIYLISKDFLGVCKGLSLHHKACTTCLSVKVCWSSPWLSRMPPTQVSLWLWVFHKSSVTSRTSVQFDIGHATTAGIVLLEAIVQRVLRCTLEYTCNIRLHSFCTLLVGKAALLLVSLSQSIKQVWMHKYCSSHISIIMYLPNMIGKKRKQHAIWYRLHTYTYFCLVFHVSRLVYSVQ